MPQCVHAQLRFAGVQMCEAPGVDACGEELHGVLRCSLCKLLRFHRAYGVGCGQVCVGVENHGLRHGVIAATAPRMAARYTPQGEPEAAYWSVATERFQSIGRAGGCEAAARRQKR